MDIQGADRIAVVLGDITQQQVDALADTLVRATGDRQQASVATAALNSWVAVNNLHGEIEIPADVLTLILSRIKTP